MFRLCSNTAHRHRAFASSSLSSSIACSALSTRHHHHHHHHNECCNLPTPSSSLSSSFSNAYPKAMTMMNKRGTASLHSRHKINTNTSHGGRDSITTMMTMRGVQRRSYDINNSRASELARGIRNSVLLIIIAINVLVFLVYQMFFAATDSGRRFFRRHMMASLATFQNLHSIVMANFTHVNLPHLLVNMFVLYTFGGTMLDVLGSRKFVQVYLIAGVISVLFFLTEKFIRAQMASDRRSRMVQMLQACCGASGSISAMVTMFCMMFPTAQIQLYFILPIRAQYFLYMTVVFEMMRLLFSSDSRISASGHLGGAAAGALLFTMLKRGKF